MALSLRMYEGLIFASRGGGGENWMDEKLALENKGEGRGERNFEGTN